MDSERGNRRRVCRKSYSIDPPSPAPSRTPKTILDTPRRARLLADARHTAGKLPRTELFKIHNIAKRTGYRILKEGTARRSDRIHNRGRKQVLAPYECEAIEAVEDSNFGFASSSHFKVAKTIGLANGSERAIQRNMKNFGVGTYMAAQKKLLLSSHIETRCIWGFERRYWHLDQFKKYRWCDESHFATCLQRQARIHRRAGNEARNALAKTQFKLKRQNQSIHVYDVIGYDFKGQLHFYTGSGIEGRLIQNDYMIILEQIVASEWDKDCVLIEDNDGSHGTKGKAFNKVKALKAHLGIQWEMNPPNSPDLNPIETIWRIIKQRLKSRGVIFEEAVLRRAIQEEWDKITLDEINKAISTMPDRVAVLNERNGRPIPY